MASDPKARRTISTDGGDGRVKLMRSERLRLVADSYCDERTVAAVYNGAVNARATTYRRVLESARRLRLPRPPVPTPVSDKVG